MTNIINKWLEIKKIKYEKLYCKHDWEKEQCWNMKDKYTGVVKEDAIILYFCKKCGEMKKIDMFSQLPTN